MERLRVYAFDFGRWRRWLMHLVLGVEMLMNVIRGMYRLRFDYGIFYRR